MGPFLLTPPTHPPIRRVAFAHWQSLANKRQPPSAYLARFTGTDVGPAGLGDKIMISCDEETLKKYPVREFEFDARISVDGREVRKGRTRRKERDGIPRFWYIEMEC